MLAVPRSDVGCDLATRDFRGELGDLALIVRELELRGARELGRYTPTAARMAASGATLRPPS